MMPLAAPPESDEPRWVRRLREDGFDVRGGSNPLPEAPDASFLPMSHARASTFGVIVGWVQSFRRRAGIRRHAPLP
jgi:hypothetical protein